MIASAAFMLSLGLATTFAPQELLHYTGNPAQTVPVLAIQTAGALYLGFAILNWMAKDNAIGGIYSRPVALGNFLHFLLVSTTLLSLVRRGVGEPLLLLVTVLYALFAIGFGLLVFGKSPSSAKHS